jgi:hypothetical protein
MATNVNFQVKNGLSVGGGTTSLAGLFSPAANTLAISTNNTERVRIDSSGNVGIGGTTSPGQKLDVVGSGYFRPATTQDGIIVSGRSGGTSSYSVTLIPTTLSASRTLTLPDTTGTIVTTGDTGSITGTMIADGTITNADISVSAGISVSKLSASTISGVTLGNNLNTLSLSVSGVGLTGSTSYDGSTAATFTVTSNATNLNTASTIVARDASGNFSAGTITAALSGNASTATVLQTARTLWGQSFDGSANVTGSLTSVGNITGTGAVTLTATSGTLGLVATGANVITATTNGTEALRIDSSGNLGLGVVPSAWATFNAFQASRGSFIGTTAEVDISHNAFYDGTWKYIANGFATNHYQSGGAYFWRTAPSGTAGNAISFTQAMTLDASGNVGIGTTSPSQKLHVVGNARITGAVYDSNNSAGTSGQALVSTGSGTSWGTAGISSGKAIAMSIVFS